MQLFLIEHPPQNHETSFSMMQADDKLLLLDDGVYFAIEKLPPSLLERGSCYALTPHLKARGIEQMISPHIICIEYSEFVNLCVAATKVISWHI